MHHQRHLRLPLLLCCVTLLAACGMMAAGQTAPDMVRQRQVVNDVTITLERPEEVRVNHQQRLVAVITDSQGQPVESASVYFDLVMPAHPMGANQPIAAGIGSGAYETGAVFTMDGEWLVTVVTTWQGESRTATFSVLVTP